MLRKNLNKLIIVFLLTVFLGFLFFNNLDLWTVRRNFSTIRYQKEIDKYAEQFSLDKELLTALIYVESRFNKNIKSHKGAIGLMQLMPTTAFWIAEELNYEDFKLEDLTNPETNIKFGSWYFAYLYQKFDKNLIKAIAAYNAGEDNVRQWTNQGWQADLELKLPFSETDNFVRRVISTRNYYQRN
ncbi:Lytic transglycosylase catalytic [Halanaerobium praevalens DSM 2228]|uniref:Lytic transglycosylase catalytic n=1 Tax=Halanaerobium praevalens (strain ATCC 33744 / DSM 2228 / GSL) TaxID=572479 RepID=E3DNP5_HALPG|nr:Lytic transglycosylase catalytic [Halanaerobium praevalens DSM 2228]